ncbi:MAG: hypothetical protein ACLQQ4_04025 [Bacteroidia bacterium]
MATISALIRQEKSTGFAAEIQKGVEYHKKTAGYLMAAAAHHYKAANQLNDGNYENATKYALLAKDYLNLAKEILSENTKTGSVRKIIAF